MTPIGPSLVLVCMLGISKHMWAVRDPENQQNLCWTVTDIHRIDDGFISIISIWCNSANMKMKMTEKEIIMFVQLHPSDVYFIYSGLKKKTFEALLTWFHSFYFPFFSFLADFERIRWVLVRSRTWRERRPDSKELCFLLETAVSHKQKQKLSALISLDFAAQPVLNVINSKPSCD